MKILKATRFWFGMVTFGMAITIPPEEMDTCRQLMRPAWIVAGLQNDLFSWEKERATATRLGLWNVINAVWVLMKEHSIDVADAKAMCRRIIKENVAAYLSIVEANTGNESLSLGLRRYMDAMKYSLSGNAVWSLICPRYHPTATFNGLQRSLMEANGVGDDTAGFHVKTPKGAKESLDMTWGIGGGVELSPNHAREQQPIDHCG